MMGLGSDDFLVIRDMTIKANEIQLRALIVVFEHELKRRQRIKTKCNL